jgi:hypothetical protein
MMTSKQDIFNFDTVDADYMESLAELSRAERREGVFFGLSGVVYAIEDMHNFRTLFQISDVEESDSARIVRVRICRPEFAIYPPCPSSSWKVMDNPYEINMRIECHEETRLFDILYMVIDGKRVIDHLEEKLDYWTGSCSLLAFRTDILFSGRRP